MRASKQIMVITLFAITGTTFCFNNLSGSTLLNRVQPISQDSLDNSKSRALIVLQNKCNACHKLENKSKVFSVDNMDDHAKKINKQVFIKKKMPKDDVKLSEQENQILRTWLEEVLITSN